MDPVSLFTRNVAEALPTTANTLGALFVGWGVSSVAFGMFCLQAWTYYGRYPSDSWGHKVLVTVIWAAEVVHQIFIGHACWHYIISDYGHGEAALFEKTIWSLSTVVVLGAFVGTVVKVYFGFRVYKLSKGNYVAAALICAMSVAQFATAMTFSIKTLSKLIIQLTQLKNLGSVSLALGASTDIVTALVLSYYLHTMRTGYRRSDTLINRLIAFSVNTGALTSACSLSVLIVYQIMPTNFIFIALYFLLCKLYSNSCLATLNSRRFASGRGTDRDESASAGNNVFAMAPRSRSITTSDFKSADVSKMSHVAIGVHQEISVLRDDETPELVTRSDYKSEDPSAF